MVAPPRLRRMTWVLVLGCSVLLTGCLVPKSRLDECHKLSQTLQARNSQLNDSVVSLRSQNQDLVERAGDDARQVQMQAEAIERLERSVVAYQKEREQLARSFDELKRQVRDPMSARLPDPVSAEAPPPALLRKFATFSEGHPGCTFDVTEAISTFDPTRLFEPGSDRLTPDGRAWLSAYARLLRAPEARDVGLRIVAPNDAKPVRRAGLASSSLEPASLGSDRAARVRDLIAASAGIDAARVEVADDDGSRPPSRGLEIHLRRLAPAATPSSP